MILYTRPVCAESSVLIAHDSLISQIPSLQVLLQIFLFLMNKSILSLDFLSKILKEKKVENGKYVIYMNFLFSGN